MTEKETERIYVIPFRKIKHLSTSNAAPRALREVRRFLSKHMKVEMEKVWIDESVNHALWSRGKYKIPSKMRVRAVKFDDGVVEASLPEMEFKSFREELKTIKESKEPILKREKEEKEETKEEKEETEEEETKEEKEETEEEETKEEKENIKEKSTKATKIKEETKKIEKTENTKESTKDKKKKEK